MPTLTPQLIELSPDAYEPWQRCGCLTQDRERSRKCRVRCSRSPRICSPAALPAIGPYAI